MADNAATIGLGRTAPGVPYPFPSMVAIGATALPDIPVGMTDEDDAVTFFICDIWRRPFMTASADGSVIPIQVGVAKRGGELLLNAMHDNRHEGSAYDWHTKETLRYAVRREKDMLVAKPLLMSERTGLGSVAWRGTEHSQAVESIWQSLLRDEGQLELDEDE